MAKYNHLWKAHPDKPHEPNTPGHAQLQEQNDYNRVRSHDIMEQFYAHIRKLSDELVEKPNGRSRERR